MNRRGFLGAVLAAGVAPYVARAESLMRMRPTASGLLVPSAELGMLPLDPALETVTVTTSNSTGVQVGDVVRMHGKNYIVTTMRTGGFDLAVAEAVAIQPLRRSTFLMTTGADE